MVGALERQPWWSEALEAVGAEGVRGLARRYAVDEAELRVALARAGVEAPERPGAAARLDAVRDELGRVSDGEIARRLGIARKTVVEYRKRRGIEAFAPPRRAPETVEAEAPAPGRSSRLDQFRDIVGKLPDREVAERAGVSTENVRMYRQRRGIPAEWRPPAESPGRRGRQPLPPGESRVERALAPVRALVGVLPDAEVAVRAGVSRSAVSAFRARQGIPAGGPRPVREPVRAAAPEATGLVYRVIATREGLRRSFGVLATDPVDAARQAWEALTARDARWVIRAIRLVGERLPGV